MSKRIARETEPSLDRDQDRDREAALSDLDARSRALLQSWMDKYIEKKAQIDRIQEDCEKIKLDQIEPLRLRLGLTKIDSDEWYIARRPGKKSLDKEKVRRYLFTHKVPLPVISAAFEEATSTGKPFTEIKRKKDKG